MERYTDKDGTSILRAVLSAVDTGEIYDLVDQLARQTKTSNDTRTMDARRADALVQLMLGRDPHLGPEDDDTPPPAGSVDGPDREPATRHRSTTSATGEPSRRGRAWRADRRAEDPHGAGSGRPGAGRTGRPRDRPTGPGAAHDQPSVAGPGTDQVRHDQRARRPRPVGDDHPPGTTPAVGRDQPTTGPDGETVHVGELQGYGPITTECAAAPARHRRRQSTGPTIRTETHSSPDAAPMTHPGGSTAKSAPETAPAGSPAADNPPTGSTSTTSSRSHAASPCGSTWAGCAGATTTSRAPAGGTSPNTTTGSTNGPRRSPAATYTTYPRGTTGAMARHHQPPVAGSLSFQCMVFGQIWPHCSVQEVGPVGRFGPIAPARVGRHRGGCRGSSCADGIAGCAVGGRFSRDRWRAGVG